MKFNQAALTILTATLCFTTLPSEAKRVGGGKSVGKQTDAPAQTTKNKADVDEGQKSSSNSALRPSVAPLAAGVAGAAAAGAAGAVAVATPAENQQQEIAEKRASERAAADLARKIRDEEIRAQQNARAAAAEKAAADAAEELRLKEAQREAEKAKKQAAIDRERSCVIRPVMTNDEIEHCKVVWR